MNISASRREDMPCYRAAKCFQIMKEGSAICTNPYTGNEYLVHIPSGSTFTWWSKNYGHWIMQSTEPRNKAVLQKYTHRFQFTINSYRPLETDNTSSVPQLCGQAIYLHKIGEVIWRYDPIVHWEGGCSYEREVFTGIASRLEGIVNTCVISFYDSYKASDARLRAAGYRILFPTMSEKMRIVGEMITILGEYAITLAACCEQDLPLPPAKCIAGDGKDPNQRHGCTCAIAKDVGLYDTCKRNCLFCYAKRSVQVEK